MEGGGEKGEEGFSPLFLPFIFSPSSPPPEKPDTQVTSEITSWGVPLNRVWFLVSAPKHGI